MNANQWLSLALLIGRVITVGFVGFTMRLQLKLIKDNVYPEYQWYRMLLFSLTAVLALGNVIPIVIDGYGLVNKGSLGLLYAYVISNNITAMLSAFITWFVYHYSRKR